jgi:hypothetical protein
MLQEDKTLSEAAMLADMDEKTARKYRKSGLLPSQVRQAHHWRTRTNPFDEIWPEVERMLGETPALQAKTLFEHFQRLYPGRFSDGQIRTFQRHVRRWRALHGPGREVFFPQVHRPGQLGASDFTHMDSLGITIAGRSFPHLLFHFVLTFSNWETGSIAFSESFESLSTGLQRALWELGGVPVAHRTDRLSSAVQNDLGGRCSFTHRYAALLAHYSMQGRPTQPASPHENGDVEQSHRRLKEAIEQELLLRANRDFASVADYEAFVREILDRRNAGRRKDFEADKAALSPLPATPLSHVKVIECRVTTSSTIHVAKNTYSVPSRLIGERVEVRLDMETLSVWYGGQCVVAAVPRIRGENNHAINYRHIIDWLVRKPGAFENYRWKTDLFPTSRFRMAFDTLQQEGRGPKHYLQILRLAALEGEAAVDEALGSLLDTDVGLSFDAVEQRLRQRPGTAGPRDVTISAVDLSDYDTLLGGAAA